MNDLLRKNNDQPTNNIDVSCVHTDSRSKTCKGTFCLIRNKLLYI